jgi:hypothetical protein
MVVKVVKTTFLGCIFKEFHFVTIKGCTILEVKSAKMQHVTQSEFTLPNVTQRYSRYGNVTVTLPKIKKSFFYDNYFKNN